MVYIGENFLHDGKSAVSKMPDLIDIDADHMDPQLCSLYAPDIYRNLQALEVCSAICFYRKQNHNLQESFIAHTISIAELSWNGNLSSSATFLTVNAGNVTDACVFSGFSFQIIRRPTSTYMEKIQQDINQSMRGILVDWLVEVCVFFILDTRKNDLFESKATDTVFCTGMWGVQNGSKYTLSRCSFCWCISLTRTRWKETAPTTWHYLYANCLVSTLYLLTNLYLKNVFSAKNNCVVLFFSRRKYEEICAPCIDELCFITANSYTKGEVWYAIKLAFLKCSFSLCLMRVSWQVLALESQVLNTLGFRLSAPTAKTFLRCAFFSSVLIDAFALSSHDTLNVYIYI